MLCRCSFGCFAATASRCPTFFPDFSTPSGGTPGTTSPTSTSCYKSGPRSVSLSVIKLQLSLRLEIIFVFLRLAILKISPAQLLGERATFFLATYSQARKQCSFSATDGNDKIFLPSTLHRSVIRTHVELHQTGTFEERCTD